MKKKTKKSSATAKSKTKSKNKTVRAAAKRNAAPKRKATPKRQAALKSASPAARTTSVPTGSKSSRAKAKPIAAARRPREVVGKIAAPDMPTGKAPSAVSSTGVTTSTWGQVTEVYDATEKANQPTDTDAGDSQGLSDVEDIAFESVSELAEDGQGLDALKLEGIEDAPDPDQGEVTVHKAPNKSGPGRFRDRNRL